MKTTLGSDHMNLGVVLIDPVAGVSSQIVDLGEFGHDGSTHHFNKNFGPFKISGGEFPKVKLVLAELSEKGGFKEYLDNLVVEAKAELGKTKHAASLDSEPKYLLAGYQIGEAAKEAAKKEGKTYWDKKQSEAWETRKDLIFEPITVSPKNTVPGRFKSPYRCDYLVTYSWRFGQ
jgi:hypothetical protein